MTGCFGAHGNLSPLLGCKQQSLQGCLHSWLKHFGAELCTDNGISCEEEHSHEVHVRVELWDSQAQQRPGLAQLPAVVPVFSRAGPGQWHSSTHAVLSQLSCLELYPEEHSSHQCWVVTQAAARELSVSACSSARDRDPLCHPARNSSTLQQLLVLG